MQNVLNISTEIVDVSSLLSGKENPVPSDDHDYYSFKTFSRGIKIHELWDYIHEKFRSGSTFFEEEFKVRNGPSINLKNQFYVSLLNIIVTIKLFYLRN